MDKMTLGGISVICLSSVVISSHYFGVNGILTASCIGLITGILGTLLGVTIGVKASLNEKKEDVGKNEL